MAVIRDLYFYPIKSFRGLRVNELKLESQGAVLDRQWMLVDAKNRFITQRTMPVLARIGLRIVDESAIELSRQDLGTVDFGLEEHEGTEFPVVIWNDTVPAFEVSSEVSAWLSEAVGDKVKLVRWSPSAKRPSPDFPERDVRFVDANPILVISTASLGLLESKIGAKMSMSRFRPNIVVDRVDAHAEDLWPAFRAGAVNFKSLKPCSRCKITCTHPLTGEVGEEPLKTLGEYRRQGKGVMFGYYFVHQNEGVVRVGDELKFG